MKHGQSSKTKSAKTSHKASNKAGSKKSVAGKVASKGGKAKAGGKKESSPKTPGKTSGTQKGKAIDSRGEKKASAAKGSNKAEKRATGITFSTPEVGTAYRRAIQKYSDALRRLSD